MPLFYIVSNVSCLQDDLSSSGKIPAKYIRLHLPPLLHVPLMCTEALVRFISIYLCDLLPVAPSYPVAFVYPEDTP